MNRLSIFERWWNSLGSAKSGHHGHTGGRGGKGNPGGSSPSTVQVSAPFVSGVLDVFYDKKERLDKIMEDGNATCPGAAYGAVYPIWLEDRSAQVIGGEFDEQAHYWAETNDYIVDIGNNIDAATRNKGIRPIIVPKDSEFGKRYSNRDEKYTPIEFLRAFKRDPFARASMDLFRKG